MAKPVAKSFAAVLERMRSRLNWVIVYIPFDVAKLWGKRGQLRIRGEINGFEFRTSLFPTGRGSHYLLVNKRMQRGGGARAGAVARFRLEPDTEVRTVTMPPELQRVLDGDRALRRWFERLNYSTRHEISKWVGEVKGGEARVRRAEQIGERLMSTMEAERELPPILQVAFGRTPGAREGWEQMSVSRRRGHLLGIFYYRNPEARARRVAKAVEDAVRIAEKGNR
jgi:uncharacterized protein YdeI (YjbR/CyaY-like superfamily)